MKTNFLKIYVAVPDHCEAGGIESLYQLIDAINNLNGDAYALFDNPHNEPIPKKYSNYNIKFTDIVDDHSENLIIYPEVWTERIYTYHNIQKAIWWLSVDNNHGKFNLFQDNTILHFYQSYYALNHLLKNNVSYYLPIFDYISDLGYDVSFKKDVVCYNPAKGAHITSIIKQQNPDIIFIPLTNMSTNQIMETLSCSKVYIDFGHHPGRDRIPREAAQLHNCIISNRVGSAFYYNDVQIKQEYKFDVPDNVGKKIIECFTEFDDKIKDFELYRSTILAQKEQMYNQVKQILGNINIC